MLDMLPRKSRSRVFHEVRFSAGQFLHLPFMDRNNVWRAGEIVPEVFHELKFLCRA